MLLLNKIAPYLKFTPNERKGVLVLLAILTVVIVIRIGLPYVKKESKVQDVSFDEIEVEQSKGKNSQEYLKKEKASTTKVRNIKGRDIVFDPNTATYNTLVKVGFSKFSAENLVKYRKSGGFFNDPNDLIRIYGIDSTFLFQIKNQVVINSKKPIISGKVESKIVIEINKANADSLELIPCIGPVLSKRIIKYRSQLGGFVSLQQLEEVYGIDSSCYTILLDHLTLDVTLIQKLDLNHLEEKAFNQHPYITKYQARAIVKYRELMGPFKRVSQLSENHIFIDSDLRKLVDYISLGDE